MHPNLHAAAAHIEEVLRLFGHDTTREGLKDTPVRVAKFLSEFSSQKEFNFTTFDAEGMDQMVVQRGIPVASLCEHHLLPIHGTAIVGYIPRNRIAGLSKLARTVEYYSRRPQNQERLTNQIADFLSDRLDPIGLGVFIIAEHQCMSVRGVRAHGAETTTVALRGAFRDFASTRGEFMIQVQASLR